ncbi:MAG: glycosyltransferase family 2 protein [Bacteroidales bacterium]|nr:glycosyltransferase family 2 protein [Bacteroidales bacterium]
MKVSLIISTYNRPDALALCLDSILRQTRMPDEVIVGDDGSGSETKAVIDRFAARCPVPVVHLWHEDKGFRLAAMRNKCIARSIGDYIVQIDSDVVLSRHFIADHLAAALPGHYAKGSRIRLNNSATEKACKRDKISRCFSPLSRSLQKDRLKAIRLPECISVPLSHHYHTTGTGLGANMAFWRKDLVAINGYDETFCSWGGEDNDIELRLQAHGVKTFKLFRCGLVRHLWHLETPNAHLAESYKYMNQKLSRGELYATEGLDKHITWDKQR